MSGIAVILPARETFSHDGAGAIAIYVRDVLQHSRLAADTAVLGHDVDEPLDHRAFVAVAAGPWYYGGRSARYLHGVCRRLVEIGPRLIEVHNRPRYIGRLKRAFPETPVILYLHNDPATTRELRSVAAREAVLAQVAAVICVSEFVRGRFLAGIAARGAEDKVHAVLNGTDVHHIRSLCAAQGAKHREIIYAGRLVPDKGAHVFAAAVARVLPDFPGWRAVLVGAKKFANSPELSDYERDVHRQLSGLGDAVEITGYVPREQLLLRFCRAAIAVVPSVWEEPCGLVAIEALASGCAIVASRRGGLVEVVGDSGVLCASLDADEFAARLRDLIVNEQARLRWQALAVERAAARLDIGATCEQLDRIRRGVMGDGA